MNTPAAPFSPLESDLLHWIARQQPLLIERLQTLIAINSGSGNPSGINQCGELLASWFGEQIPDCLSQRIPLDELNELTMNGDFQTRRLGDLWQFHLRPEAPLQILLCGHLDTVFAADNPFQSSQYLNATRLNGPGAADMKGGLLVMLTALQALEQHPMAKRVGWSVILNPDEEIGSPGSAPYLTEAAGRHHLGLVFEPALPDGNLAGARKGSGNFTLVIRGRSAHAGRDPEQGRNAIHMAAEIICQLQRLNGQRPGLTLNTGIIQGGDSANKVPDCCTLRFNIRIQATEDAEWCRQQLKQILTTAGSKQGYGFQIHGDFGRLPKKLSEHQLTLYKTVQKIASRLDLSLSWQATGGCCDGNNLAAAGLANVDTLGVRGNHIHSNREYIELDSLTERSQLSALLLWQLAETGFGQAGGQHE